MSKYLWGDKWCSSQESFLGLEYNNPGLNSWSWKIISSGGILPMESIGWNCFSGSGFHREDFSRWNYFLKSGFLREHFTGRILPMEYFLGVEYPCGVCGWVMVWNEYTARGYWIYCIYPAKACTQSSVAPCLNCHISTHTDNFIHKFKIRFNWLYLTINLSNIQLKVKLFEFYIT